MNNFRSKLRLHALSNRNNNINYTPLDRDDGANGHQYTETSKKEEADSNNIVPSNSDSNEELKHFGPQNVVPTSSTVAIRQHSPLFGNVTGFSLLKNPNFLLVLAYMFIVDGAGLMFINNLGSLLLSGGGSKDDAATIVIAQSVANFFGRLIFGIMADRFQAPSSRPMLMVCVSLFMGSFHLGMAFVNPVFTLVMISSVR